jgi:ribonuclease R
VLGVDGQVAAIVKRPRNRAHRVVEEFMLAANEAVARWFGARELPTIYRVHGVPDEEKLDAFLELARTHGFDVPDSPSDPRALNELLERFKGHAQQRALNQLLLRAMMQAVYSPENIGHYGLAAEHYLHFTSPIRRYPDLVVHRLLKEEWARRRAQVQPDEAGPERARGPGGREPRARVPPARSADAVRRTPEPRLVEMAAISSDRERASMEAEREIASFYAALFMKDKVGEVFDGIVAAVVEFGLFVELERWFVEGLVRVEELGEGFELDPVLHALVQPGTGRAFRVGDRLRVEVVSSSPARRRIELRAVDVEQPAVRREAAVRGAPRGTGAPPRKPPRAERGPRPGRAKRRRARS